MTLLFTSKVYNPISLSQLNSQFKVEISKSKLREILSLEKGFEEHHPLIYQCQSLDDSRLKYIIREKPYSWLPIKIDYDARVSVEENGIQYQLTRIPFHEVTIAYEILEFKKGMIEIDSKIDVSGPPLIATYLLRKISSAQRKTFQSIRKSYQSDSA